MKLAIEAPPPIVEVLELYTRAGLIKPLELKVVTLQWAKSDVFGFRNRAGELVAAIGFCPMPSDAGETVLELWFACSASIRPHLVEIAHIARLTLAKIADTSGLRLRAHVKAGHRPGQRIARLVCMERVGEV